MRTLIRELAGTLEDVVGIEDASGYISVVGGAIGGEIDAAYRNALNVSKLSRSQVAAVLVDLICDQEGRINIPGVFVAGDASRGVQLAIIAGAEGARASLAINKNLLDEDG